MKKQKYELLSPTLDVVFKMLFASKRGRQALIGLLNAILKPASKITSVEVLNPQIPKLLVEDKGTVLDIHAKLADGTLIDIEMQMTSKTALPKRALYYATRMYSSELKVGDQYDRLRPVIVIFLVAEDLFPSRPRDFEVAFSLQQEDTGSPVMEELQGEIRLIFVEIIKAFRLWQERQLPPDDVTLGAWLAFLAAPNSPIVKEACMSMPELKDAKDALEDLSAEDEAREIARLREKARLDMDSIMANAKKEGRAEGIAEGEAKGRAEGKAEGRAEAIAEQSLILLKKLLSDAVTSALSNAHLAELTGLTEVEVARERVMKSK